VITDKSKILFLDVDGVLNSVRSCYALGGFPHSTGKDDLPLFDNVALGFIRRLVKETGCEIVLSSTWRLTEPYLQFGNDLKLPVMDRTPCLNKARGHEIQHWLDNNPWAKYAIVDDDSDMLPEQMPYFVKTDVQVGLMTADFEKLMALLK